MSENSLYLEETPEPKKGAKSAPSQPTVLDRLKETISKKVERATVHLEVPERPNVTLIIAPNISQHDMRRWRKAAGEDSKNGMDATRFACSVIGHTTVGIAFDGEEVMDEDGYPLNFASSVILEMTDTDRPIPEAVRAFFGIDPHIEAAALAILDAAGYGETVDTVDPTKGS